MSTVRYGRKRHSGAKLRLDDARHDARSVGTQYMLIAMAVAEIGGLVYFALTP